MYIRKLAYLLIALFLVSCAKEPTASFTASTTNAKVDEVITFTNLSVDATTYAWDFGDGSSSVAMNPTHAFTSAGNYSVTLTATGDGGSNSSTQSITVIAVMTGEWEWSFVSNNTSFTGSFDMEEAADGKLTGTFEFSDGSGFAGLESSSNITGDAVMILVDHRPTYNLVMSFQGTANDDRDFMNGDLYTNGSLTSPFTANKTSKKSTFSTDSELTISAMERYLDVLLLK